MQQYIDEYISKGMNVLVHCHAGMQRSATMVAVYLMVKYGCNDIDNIIYFIKSKQNKETDGFDMVIYIHLCENYKFYVGTSGQGPGEHSRMVNRLKQHLQPFGGSKLTRENKVVSRSAYFLQKLSMFTMTKI